MRAPFLAAALLAATASLPALAQDADDAVAENSGIAEAAALMDDPEMQEQASLMAAALVGMLLEMPVGQLAGAMGEVDGVEAPAIDPDATVRDLMGEGANGAPERVAERLPQMMEAMAGMAGAFEEMLPALRELAERLPRQLPQAE